MRKVIILILFAVTFLSSCKKEDIKITSTASYFLKIQIDNNEGKKTYIQKLLNPTEIDSSVIKNGISIFKGKISSPERYILTIENVFGGKMFVLENDSIAILINNNDLIKASVLNSSINDELIKVQKESENIYNKIDQLFPDLQRARLENDAITLKEISGKMTSIEEENIEYNFAYANQNPKSYISAMILNDLSKRDSIDIDKVFKIYSSLSSEVKKSADAQIISNLIP